jgi:hypothetical protein
VRRLATRDSHLEIVSSHSYEAARPHKATVFHALQLRDRASTDNFRSSVTQSVHCGEVDSHLDFSDEA